VVDAGGNLKSHVRMDGANIGSITIAINKAYTAIAFHCETGDLQGMTPPDGPIYGLNDAHGGRLVVFPGGIPLVRGREHRRCHRCVDGIDRSGSTGGRGGRCCVLGRYGGLAPPCCPRAAC